MNERLHRRDRKGIAILVAITTFMFMSTLVTDISFGARVRFLNAAHERDEAKAYWLANTGIGLYRILLVANKQIAGNEMIKSYLDQMGIPANDALWSMIPFINTGLLRLIFVEGSSLDEEDVEGLGSSGRVSDEVAQESREEGGGRFGGKNFLDFEGDFNATVRGEDCRVNVNQLSTRTADKLPQDTAVGQQLTGLMSGEENDAWLRERNLDRIELIGNLADWVDSDNTVASGRGGYEDDFYNRQSPPYLSKNAKFDTQQEIRLVEGWQDEVYDRWASQITIYGSGKININCADETVLAGLLKAYITPVPSDDDCQRILELMREQTAVTSFSKGKDFSNWLTTNLQMGTVSPDLASAVDVKTTVFTVESTGQVGDGVAMITAVLDFSTSSSGKTTYWRVD